MQKISMVLVGFALMVAGTAVASDSVADNLYFEWVDNEQLARLSRLWVDDKLSAEALDDPKDQQGVQRAKRPKADESNES